MLYRDGRLVTTAGVAELDGRYFLAKRKPGGAMSQKWEFPGGKCDAPGEPIGGCLEREFAEELNLRVSVGRELGAVPFQHNNVNYLLVAIEVSFLDSAYQLREHTEAGWFAPSELVLLDLAPSDRALLPLIGIP